jgi:azurin
VEPADRPSWVMMLPPIRLVPCVALAALLLAGCGRKNEPAASAPAAPAPASGPRVIAITGSDQMKYDVTAIQASPGEDLKVTLTNPGSLPQESMAHNWVLLKAGADAAAFANAAVGAKSTDYLPNQLQEEVIAHIGLVGPHQTGEVEFNAPTVPGDYVFLCTFPAHYLIGMHGVLTVK